MKKQSVLITLLSILFCYSCKNNVSPPAAFGPIPTQKQIDWHEMEFYAFVHFSLNTFTNKEWGYGNESPDLFDPSELDTKQWARIAKEAGMKGIIITAKHHDGFCLWPSKFTERSVKNSPWKNGNGDVIKELAEACKAYDLKLGIYLSPWDRNHPNYGGPEYITYFRNQLKELLTGYGDIFEMWFDGANGGDGYYGGANETRKINTLDYYNWEETYKLIYETSPNTLVWGVGPSEARWIGNEEGRANPTNWSLLRQKDELAGKVHYTEFMSGHENGEKWVPGEADVSIRPGWFYHAVEDNKVRPLEEMVDIYYESIGRNANLLLNLPVDKRGLVHKNDEARLKELAKTIREDFKTNLLKNTTPISDNTRGNASDYATSNLIDENKNTYWTTDDSINRASISFKFKTPTALNRIALQEYIQLGQRIKKFTVKAKIKNKWESIAEETTIGYKRILRFNRITTSEIKIIIEDAKASPILSEIAAYNAPTLVRSPEVSRDKDGIVTIKAEDKIFYTIDGTIPTTNSNAYSKPFKLSKATILKTIAYNSKEGISSEVYTKAYGNAKEKWKIIATTSGNIETADRIIDGNPTTTWGFGGKNNLLPQAVTIDLGKINSVNGFTYFPQQTGGNLYLISKYELYTSKDLINWTKQAEGEFSNIKHNPIEQVVPFETVVTRYLKFVAIAATENNKSVSIGEIGIIQN